MPHQARLIRTDADAHVLVEDLGITLAEVARKLRVTTSAIFNMLKGKNGKFK